MKKLFRRFWPSHLWAEIKLLRLQVASATVEIKRLHDANCELRQQQQPDEQTARAMLMQLRVHQESVRRRTGYMVSAFIPQGVVEKIAHDKAKFVSLVAEVLVNNAINGILRRSAATNKLTALIFEPVNRHGQNVKLVGGFFETDQGPEIQAMMPPSEHVDTKPAMLPQNSYLTIGQS